MNDRLRLNLKALRPKSFGFFFRKGLGCRSIGCQSSLTTSKSLSNWKDAPITLFFLTIPLHWATHIDWGNAYSVRVPAKTGGSLGFGPYHGLYRADRNEQTGRPVGASTAGKKCPICGKWISTDIPRISFTARRGQTAADVVQREFLAHLRTYHPDYLRWTRPYQIIGVGLAISELVFALSASSLSIPLLLLAILVPLVVGIPLVLAYRRKLKAFKKQWSDEHPLASAS